MGRFFAAVYDKMLKSTEEAGLRDTRQGVVGGARGDVLELGAGTGLNFGHYVPGQVTQVIATEPDPHMARRARKAAAGAPVPIEVREASAEDLPFDSASFDTVVCTLVMCTIPNPGRAVTEVERVLKPGGKMLFIEHVRAEDPGLAKWQDRLERPWTVVGAGCHPNRDTLGLLDASPLDVDEYRRGKLPKSPPIVRPMVVGAATKTSRSDPQPV